MLTDKYATKEEGATVTQEGAKDAKIANHAPAMTKPKHKKCVFYAFIKSLFKFSSIIIL